MSQHFSFMFISSIIQMVYSAKGNQIVMDRFKRQYTLKMQQQYTEGFEESLKADARIITLMKYEKGDIQAIGMQRIPSVQYLFRRPLILSAFLKETVT